MKQTIKLSVLIVVFSIFTNSLKAQNELNDIIDTFFEMYEDSPLEAIDYAFDTNKWMKERNLDGIENVKNRLTNVLELIGDYYGHEKITKKNIGESFTLVSYMVKYDRQPMRFTFIFYKPNDIWQVQSFQFDDKLDEELEEYGKVYRIEEN